MSNKVILISNDGIGGSLLTASAASFVSAAGNYPVIYMPSRDEIFRPYKYLLQDKFEVKQAPEGYASLIHKPEDVELYVVYPDGVYNNRFSFDYKKYNTNPQLLRSNRILTHKYFPVPKNIYLGLTSSTAGYSYEDVPSLLKELYKVLPDYTFHLPIISKWAGQNISSYNLDNLPENVRIYKDDDFCNQINILKSCEYCICLDNGISHIAYHLGMPRLVLDSRYGLGRHSLPWIVRWFEDINEHIRIQSFPQDIAQLVNTNIKIPQTTLLPRQFVLNNSGAEWTRELLIKD